MVSKHPFCVVLGMVLGGLVGLSAALAQTPSGETIQRSIAITDRTPGTVGRLSEPADSSFSARFYRYVTNNGISTSKANSLERGEPPLWLQDHMMGQTRDRPGRARTGPEMGSFYDERGRLRLYRSLGGGKFEILDAKSFAITDKITDMTIDLAKRALGYAQDTPPRHKAELDLVKTRTFQEWKQSEALYKALYVLSEKVGAGISDDVEDQPDSPAAGALPDDCTYDDATYAAFTDRLVQETDPSRIASLTSRFRKSKDVQSLRNCICRHKSGASGNVSVSYAPEPVGGSPSCEDVRGGPCVNSGYGCWRTPFVPDRAALEACGAAKLIAKAICERRKAQNK